MVSIFSAAISVLSKRPSLSVLIFPESYARVLMENLEAARR